MKQQIYILTAIFSLLSFTLQAQDKPAHNIGLSAEAGFSNLFFGPGLGAGLATPSIGGGGGAALFYELQYKHLLFRTGFGMDYTVNTNKVNVPDYEAKIAEYPTTTYHYQFRRFVETTSYGVGYVPVMFGGIFDKVFFLVGAKIGVASFGGTTQPDAKTTIWGTDEDVIDPMRELYTHQLTDYNFTGTKRTMDFNPINIMGSVEIGINLDRSAWTKDKEQKTKGKRPARQDKASLYRRLHSKKAFKDCLHYRLSLFADYGFSNLYKPSSVAPVDELLTFNGVSDITPNSMFAYSPNRNGVLNNFMIGVKFAIMYEIPRKAPKKGDMANPYIVTFVSDELTGKHLAGATVTTQAVPKGKTKKKPVKKVTDSKFGRVQKAYAPGDYIISASKTGYIPHEPFTFTHEDKYDTLHIALYPQRPLRSQVIDAKTGRHVTAQVTISDEEGTMIAKTTLDSVAGVLSTLVDDRKQYTLCASAKGYYDTCMLATDIAEVQVLQLEPKRIQRFVLKNMFFATDKTKILPSSENALQDLYKLLSDNPDIRIRIIGHTDDVGKDDYNQRLSEGRSASVKQEMVTRGIDPKRIETTGHGEKDPIVANDSDEHRQMNRRVEIEILSGASVDAFIQNEQLSR